MTTTDLDFIINSIQDMKPLPVIVTQIIRLTEDPKTTIQHMEELILQDQVLTSKILRVANSAYYTYNRKISTISQAAVLIGFRAIKGIAFASVLSKYMSDELKGYSLQKNELWTQSQTCAIICRQIAKRIRYEDPEEAYVAGLLRDIGKTVLSQFLEKKYNEVLNLIDEEGIHFIEAEKRVLGFSHMEIGARVAANWNLPEHLVNVIRFHHNPEEATDDKDLINIVHIADAMTMMMGVGLGLDGLAYHLSGKALEEIGLNQKALEDIMSQVIDIINDENNFLMEI